MRFQMGTQIEDQELLDSRWDPRFEIQFHIYNEISDFWRDPKFQNTRWVFYPIDSLIAEGIPDSRCDPCFELRSKIQYGLLYFRWDSEFKMRFQIRKIFQTPDGNGIKDSRKIPKFQMGFQIKVSISDDIPNFWWDRKFAATWFQIQDSRFDMRSYIPDEISNCRDPTLTIPKFPNSR